MSSRIAVIKINSLLRSIKNKKKTVLKMLNRFNFLLNVMSSGKDVIFSRMHCHYCNDRFKMKIVFQPYESRASQICFVFRFLSRVNLNYVLLLTCHIA